MADDLVKRAIKFADEVEECMGENARAFVEALADEIERLNREHDAALAQVAALREMVARIPNALNSAFGAGREECEGGSGRRQAKLIDSYDDLYEKARTARDDTAAAAAAHDARMIREGMERAEQLIRSVTIIVAPPGISHREAADDLRKQFVAAIRAATEGDHD